MNLRVQVGAYGAWCFECLFARAQVVENPKGDLLECFGAHAVHWAPLGDGFQFEVWIGPTESENPEMPRVRGDVESTRQSAEKSAFRAALRQLQEFAPGVVASSSEDFKGKLESKLGIRLEYDTKEAETGGFRASIRITVEQEELEISRIGRRKLDAEQLAAQAALEKLESTDTVLASAPEVQVDEELRLEAFREQCKEHERLKELLQRENLPNFKKIRQNLSSCIDEAFRLQLIDEVEKKRLQQINGRGNCAKHAPERLRPREEASGYPAEDGGLDEMD